MQEVYHKLFGQRQSSDAYRQHNDSSARDEAHSFIMRGTDSEAATPDDHGGTAASSEESNTARSSNLAAAMQRVGHDEFNCSRPISETPPHLLELPLKGMSQDYQDFMRSSKLDSYMTNDEITQVKKELFEVVDGRNGMLVGLNAKSRYCVILNPAQTATPPHDFKVLCCDTMTAIENIEQRVLAAQDKASLTLARISHVVSQQESVNEALDSAFYASSSKEELPDLLQAYKQQQLAIGRTVDLRCSVSRPDSESLLEKSTFLTLAMKEKTEILKRLVVTQEAARQAVVHHNANLHRHLAETTDGLRQQQQEQQVATAFAATPSKSMLNSSSVYRSSASLVPAGIDGSSHNQHYHCAGQQQRIYYKQVQADVVHSSTDATASSSHHYYYPQHHVPRSTTTRVRSTSAAVVAPSSSSYTTYRTEFVPQETKLLHRSSSIISTLGNQNVTTTADLGFVHANDVLSRSISSGAIRSNGLTQHWNPNLSSSLSASNFPIMNSSVTNLRPVVMNAPSTAGQHSIVRPQAGNLCLSPRMQPRPFPIITPTTYVTARVEQTSSPLQQMQPQMFQQQQHNWAGQMYPYAQLQQQQQHLSTRVQ